MGFGKEAEKKMAKREERKKEQRRGVEKRFLLWFHFPNYSSSSNT